MKLTELRNKTEKDLAKNLVEIKTELHKVGIAVLKGKEKNFRKRMQLKKDYARVMTVLKEKAFLSGIKEHE